MGSEAVDSVDAASAVAGEEDEGAEASVGEEEEDQAVGDPRSGEMCAVLTGWCDG